MQNKTIVEELRPHAVGEKLRSLRLKKSMGLVELGRHRAWDSTTFSPTSASDTWWRLPGGVKELVFPTFRAG